jgi:hypothetical protein
MNPGADDGPPPNGVFPPGVADKRQPADKPLTVTMIDNGSDPKAKFLPVNTFLEGQPFELTVVFVEGRAPQAVKMDLVATFPKVGGEDNKGDAKKPPKKDAPDGDDAKEEEAPKPEPITAATAIHFTIAGIRAHEELPLPKETLDKYNTLRGTRVAGVIMPNGALTGETFELAKKADPSTLSAVRALVDMISLFFTPYPKDPVGLGGYWIASDRANMGGLDLVRYRVFKVEQQKGDELVLSVDLRLYAASPSAVPQGAPAGSIALKFQGQGKAAMTRKRGQLLPIEGQLQAPIALQYAPSPDAQTGQMFQLQYAAGWAPFKTAEKGDDKKKAPAAPQAPAAPKAPVAPAAP